MQGELKTVEDNVRQRCNYRYGLHQSAGNDVDTLEEYPFRVFSAGPFDASQHKVRRCK
jgi:hypothetical protein